MNSHEVLDILGENKILIRSHQKKAELGADQVVFYDPLDGRFRIVARDHVVSKFRASVTEQGKREGRDLISRYEPFLAVVGKPARTWKSIPPDKRVDTYFWFVVLGQDDSYPEIFPVISTRLNELDVDTYVSKVTYTPYRSLEFTSAGSKACN